MVFIPGMKQSFTESEVINPGEYPTTDDRAAAASRAQQMDYLPLSLAITSARTAAADLFGTPIDKDKARGVYEQFGMSASDDDLNGALTMEGTMRRAKIKRDEAYRATQIARARQSTALTTRMLLEGFGVQFLDPVNYLVGGLSLTAAPAFVAGVSSKGWTAGKAAQVAVRANAAKASSATVAQSFGRGAVEGLAGNALLEIPTYPLANYAGYDYTLTDSLIGIAVGAPFGGIIHAAPKAFRAARGKINTGKLKALAEDGMPDDLRDKIMADVADDEMMDMAPIAARSTKDLEGEFGELLAEAEDAGIDVQGVSTPVFKPQDEAVAQMPVAPSPHLSTASELKKHVAEVQRKAEKRALAAAEKPADLLGATKKRVVDNRVRPIRKYFQEKGYIKRGSAAHQELIDARVDEAYIKSISRADGKITSLDNTPASQLGESLRDYDVAVAEGGDGYVDLGWLKERMYEEVGNPLMTSAQREKMQYDDQMERLRGGIEARGVKVETASAEDIARAIDDMTREDMRQSGVIENSLGGIINAADDAAEMIQSVSPQTRVAAHAIATRQMLDGNPVNIEHVLAMDAKSGKPRPTSDEIADAMDTHIDEDDLRFYDEMGEAADYDAPLTDAEMTQVRAEAEKFASEPDIPFEPLTVREVEVQVRKSFGKHTNKIMDAAKIKVVQGVDELPDEFDYKSTDGRGVQGVKMPDGTVYIVAGNLDPRANIQGLVLHEMGVHVGLRSMLGNTQFQRLLDDVMSSDNPRVRQARERVPEDTQPEHIAEETLAYLVEFAPHDDFVGNVVGAIKAWLMRTFGMKFSVDEFTARHLAIGALRRVSSLGERGDGMMFSRAVDDKQATIPGAEPISDKQLAERKMEQPLKAAKPQREMDVGLFAPEDKQMVMFSKRSEPKKAERPKLADELRIFDDALKEAENYEPALRAALDSFGDSVAMRKQLSQNGVSNEMLDYVLDVITESHKRVRRTVARKKKANQGEDMLSQLSTDTEMMAKQMAESIKEKINLDKLNAMRGFIAREKAYQRFQRFGVGFAYEAISSILTGSSMLRQGARENISSLHKSYVRGWVGSLEAAMKRDGVWEMFTKDVHERDVAKALERMDDDKPDFTGIHKDAVKIAKVVYKVREHARMTQNSFGANIKQFRNYVTRQSHDQIKVHNAGFDEWYAYIQPRLDMKSMGLNANNEKKALREVYTQIASGNYEVELPTSTSIVDYRKGANIAKRASESRELIFKRDAWFDYNQKFGTNTLKASLVKALDKAGRDSALMRMLGPNPQDNLDRVIEQISNELSRQDANASLRFNTNKQDALRNQLMVVDGRSNIAGNVLWAKINSNVRAWQVMAKLGGAVFSSTPDIAIYARNFSRFEGRGNIFEGMAEAVKAIATNHSAGESREILDALGIVFENTIADITHTLNKNGTFTDNVSAATRIFTKLNLQVPWTTQLQKGASIGLSNHLAKSAGKSFDQLSDELKNIFKIHNINGAKWDVIRKAVGEAEDGRMYLDTHALSRMDDVTMTKYIESLGRKATPISIEKAREAITADLRAFFIDRAESAVLSSDARTQAAVLRGTKRGEPTGELLRYVMQFKSFPLMIYERVLKREVYGLGYDSLADYWARGKGDMVGFANFLATMTAMGYLSMTIKDALAQREPRPLDKAGTWVEAMRRSGAMGLYGDFLLQEYDRHAGAGLAEAIMGPVVGAAGDITEIVTAAINGDKFATKALRTIQGNTPGANLFYVKPALDNLIMWNLYESASPGFLRRMQQNVQERTGQQFFAPPAQTALRY